MLVYDPLWETLRKKGISQYKLLNEYGFSHGTLNSLMEMLGITDINDVLCYVPDEK